MPTEVELTQNRMNAVITSSLNSAASIITRDYLDKLETFEIKAPSLQVTDIDISDCGKFYKLTRLVIDNKENFLNKLTTVVNVASSIEATLVTVIKSDGNSIDYYFGIISKKFRRDDEFNNKRRYADNVAFKGALEGNLIGSDIEEVNSEEIKYLKENYISKHGSYYSSVSGVVSLRNEDEKDIDSYVQGIENLVDSLKGSKYTIIMFADPVDTSEIQTIKRGYETLYTQLSAFKGSTITFNEGDTVSVSNAYTKGFSEGISNGISMTQSKTESHGKSSGTNFGFNLGINMGINQGINNSISGTRSRTSTSNKSFQNNISSSETLSLSKNEGKSLQLSYENRSVKTLLDKIDKHLERLDKCESFGAFDCATYIVADDRETSLAVASNYNALMRGEKSHIQASHINSWYKPEDTDMIGKYLGAMVHPTFYMQGENDRISVTPASIISGNELAIQIGLPKKSVSGLTVIPMAPFGRNIPENCGTAISIGNIYHMGKDDGNKENPKKVVLDIKSLAMHTFITGSTGAGKSTVIYSILDKLIKCNIDNSSNQKIKFMVVEPAKGEYKNRFGNYSNVNVYGTNYKKSPILRINPFSFPEDIHVLEHIDRLIEIFNVCWPMYAAMPAVLKDAIERAYVVSGWDLKASECKYQKSDGIILYPNFLDVLNQINYVMDNSSYSSDGKGDYKGALCTRIKSLTNGFYGDIFTSDELTYEELFDNNVIVDLSRIGSSETKSLIMGLLVMKLQEYRMSSTEGMNLPLKHVTVLEEAHNLLKKTSTEQTAEHSNLIGKSVEMLNNAIAEMRTYGEGFIIADQAPGLLDMAAIRNTNTKIVLRLPDISDRELVGKSSGLNDEQIIELSHLKPFVASVYQNNWSEPVLCKIPPDIKECLLYTYKYKEKSEIMLNGYIKYVLSGISERKSIKNELISELIQSIYKLPISSKAKADFIKLTHTDNITEIRRLNKSIIGGMIDIEKILKDAAPVEYSSSEWCQYIINHIDIDMSDYTLNKKRRLLVILAEINNDLYKRKGKNNFLNVIIKYLYQR